MNTPASNTRFIVAMISILGALCIAAGAFLLIKGFQGGEIFATAGTGAISGLLGMLNNRTPSAPDPAPTPLVPPQPPTAPGAPNSVLSKP